MIVWAKDIGIGFGFIAITMASMWMLGQLAEICTQMNICS